MPRGTTPDPIYVYTIDGKFAIQYDTPNDKTTPRTNKTGHEVNEELFNMLSGNIVDANPYTKRNDSRPDDKYLILDIDDGQDLYKLRLYLNGKFATCFFQVMEQIDYSVPVTLELKGKYLNFMQHGVQLQWTYTQADPQGKPDWEEVQLRGQTIPDNSKEVAWFMAKLDGVKVSMAAIGQEQGEECEEDQRIEEPVTTSHDPGQPFE